MIFQKQDDPNSFFLKKVMLLDFLRSKEGAAGREREAGS